MNLPDPNWVNAFKLPTQVMIGLFIASGTLLSLDSGGILALAEFDHLAKPLVIVLTVISGSLSITGIGSFVKDLILGHRKQSLLVTRREMKLQEAKNKKENAENAAVDRIDHLSSQEIRYLADSLRKGSQSFYTYVHTPSVTTLIGKGLAYTPGGTHNQDYYPFIIHDFAWEVLLARKDEIIAMDDENRKREEAEKRRGR